ncbi:c-type cytochrome biogenesis protein CcsB [Nocardioides solisilvae]|uniref:c-type cytochrome biogenesis protein CcsB n=1 Tax=Nocardioides solisilvae TaxID=1542435 RepID=UPI000D740E67|nr:c-type cytochrome biogenesis protein CcsB [Nocardioides solisilvae]
MTDTQWENLSNQAIFVAGVVYFLALLAHLVEWAALRKIPSYETPTTGRTAMFGRLGVLLTVIATGVHFVALLGRGMAADPNRVPWGNMYEFTISGAFFVSLLYLVLHRRFQLSWMAPLVVGFVLAASMTAVIWLYDPVAPLTEALYSPWLVIHVVSAIIATGAFTLGGITSALFLLKARSERRAAERVEERVAVPAGGVATGEPLGRPAATQEAGGSGPRTGYLARVPDTATLDRISYRMHAFGFPVWTFAVLITGPIWAHEAWSSYWSWDPKEVWAFITWVVYAAYLHARTTAGWRGRNAAILALVGVATLWFNFIGINFFSTTSQHSYAQGVEDGGAVQAAVVAVGPAVAGQPASGSSS